MDARDEPWVAALVREYQRFSGRPRRELHQRLQEPLPFYVPRQRACYIIKALAALFPHESRYPKKCLLDVRRRLFHASESVAWPIDPLTIEVDISWRRDVLLEQVKKNWSGAVPFPAESVDDFLFADLPSEKHLSTPNDAVDLGELLLNANTLLVKSLMKKCNNIEFLARGQIRPVIRQAKWRGLLCQVFPIAGHPDFDAKILLSGPLSIFRSPRLYGLALAEILPFLAACDFYELNILITQLGPNKSWIIKSGDPIQAKCPADFYDSKLEKRFARDFCKLTNDFDLVREPAPVQAGARLIFPDFAILHRTNRQSRWLLEIVGYWTKDYIEKKVTALQAAQIDRLILCIDKKLGTEWQWPRNALIVLFEKKIDAGDVLRIIQ